MEVGKEEAWRAKKGRKITFPEWPPHTKRSEFPFPSVSFIIIKLASLAPFTMRKLSLERLKTCRLSHEIQGITPVQQPRCGQDAPSSPGYMVNHTAQHPCNVVTPLTASSQQHWAEGCQSLPGLALRNILQLSPPLLGDLEQCSWEMEKGSLPRYHRTVI